LERLKIIRFIHSSTSDCQDPLRRRLVVRVGTFKGSTISHMAAVQQELYRKKKKCILGLQAEIPL